MTHYLSTLVLIATLAISTGCREQVINALPPPVSTSPPISSTLLPTTPSAPLPTFTPPRVPPTPSADSTLTPTSTTAPTAPVVTGWSTFTYNIGLPRISIDYPTGWNVEVLDFPSLSSLFWVQFFPPNDLRDKGVALVIDTFDNVADPRHRPNMGFWCPPPWVRLLEIPEVQDGFIYLVCPVGGDTSYTQLSAYYSSEKYRLKISITPGLYIDRTILQSPSITDTITQQYGVYEHMMESVRLTEPQ